MHLVRSSPKMLPKSTGSITSLQWKLTLRARSRKWSNNVRFFFLPHRSEFIPEISGPEWHDGIHDARPGFRHPRCGRSNELCRDHEACQINGIFRHRIRYSTYRSHSPISFIPHRLRESTREVEYAKWSVRSHDPTGKFTILLLRRQLLICERGDRCQR